MCKMGLKCSLEGSHSSWMITIHEDDFSWDHGLPSGSISALHFHRLSRCHLNPRRPFRRNDRYGSRVLSFGFRWEVHGRVSFVVADCIRSKSEEERLIAVGIWCLFKIKASYLPSLLIRYFCFQKLSLRFGYVVRVFGVVVSVRVPIGRCWGILTCDLCFIFV